MLLAFILFIFELINFKVQNVSINVVDPLSFKINTEKFETISMTLIFSENIENRNKSKIYLSISNTPIIIDAKENQDHHNLKKVEFRIDQKLFENDGRYKLTFIKDDIYIEYSQTIFIYINESNF